MLEVRIPAHREHPFRFIVSTIPVHREHHSGATWAPFRTIVSAYSEFWLSVSSP